MAEALALALPAAALPVAASALDAGVAPIAAECVGDPFSALLAMLAVAPAEAPVKVAPPVVAKLPVTPVVDSEAVAELGTESADRPGEPEQAVTPADAPAADPGAEVAAMLAAMLPLSAPPAPVAAPIRQDTKPEARTTPQMPVAATVKVPVASQTEEPAPAPSPVAMPDQIVEPRFDAERPGDAPAPAAKPAAQPVAAEPVARAPLSPEIAAIVRQVTRPVPVQAEVEAPAEPQQVAAAAQAVAPVKSTPAPMARRAIPSARIDGERANPREPAAERPVRREAGERVVVEPPPRELPVLPANVRDEADAKAVPAAAIAAPAPAEATVQRQLAIAQDGLWLDQLARDIARTAGNTGDLHFKLDPANLGALAVHIAQGAEGASIRLTADTEQARTIIADAQPKLVAEARAQGLRVSDTQVDLSRQGGGGSGGSAAWGQAGQQQHDARQQPAALPIHQPSSPNSDAEEPAGRPQRPAGERYA